MKKILFAASLLASVVAFQPIIAQGVKIVDTEELRLGNHARLSGRVLNENGDPLPGAVVYIDGTTTATVADVQGFFILNNIDEGRLSVKVQYVGCEDFTAEVDLKKSTAMDVIITIDEGQSLEQVEVVGILSGRRKALQTQKSAMGVSNVISADQMDRFPDDNIGDALKRIPGINVQYDQGEARFGQIRGTSPDLTSVTINGNRTPSAEDGSRAAQLDLIPAEMIEMVDVKKVVTSDMDGDAIGGSVDLITKSAPSRMIGDASFSTGYNLISGKMNYTGSASWGDRFFGDKLGVMAAVSYQNNPIGSDNIEAEWKYQDDGTGEERAYLDDFQNRQYYLIRERQSYSLSTDYVFNANHKLMFKGMYNRRNDWENRYRLRYQFEGDEYDFTEGATNEYRVNRQTKGGTEDVKYSRLERQQTMDFNFGGEHRLSHLLVDWNIDYAKASEERPNERYITYRIKSDDNYIVDMTDTTAPSITAKDADDAAFNSDNFKLSELTEQFKLTEEKEIKASVNFKLDLVSGDFANRVKFGYKLQDKKKTNDIKFYEYDGSVGDDFTTNSFNNYSDQSVSSFMAGDYKIGNFINREYLGDLNFSDMDGVVNDLEEAESYKGRETINAAYIRFDQRLGRKFDLVAGVRLEQTFYDYTGNDFSLTEYDSSEGLYSYEIVQTTNRRTETNVLPSVLLKYTPNRDVVLRASFTSTIARPKFSDLVPGNIVELDDDEPDAIVAGNPDLKSTVSNNFDLMAEYYTKNSGMFSVGLYYKQIDNFITDIAFEDYSHNGVEWKDFEKSVNAGDATLFGVEVAMQQSLEFISPALRNFGVYANYTFNKSDVKRLNDELLLAEGRTCDEFAMPGTPEHIANASLYFENKRFSVALSYNFASAFLDSIGESSEYDVYYDKVNYLDVNMSFNINKRLTLFAEVNNILNQGLRYYQGSSEYVYQYELYGVKTQVGLKARF
ncbi:MAG: TonB-dependent receptor [Rikenellaceae bacterium]